MARPETQTCGTCYYFNPIKGSCQRFPPPEINPTGDATRTRRFPLVSQADWCGEWKKE